MHIETDSDWTDECGGRWVVTLAWGEVNGRPEPSSVLIRSESGSPLQGDILRRLPLGGIVKKVRRAIAQGSEPPSPDMGLLDGVAATYRRAWRMGLDPVVAVADKWGISRSTAAKWVMAARRGAALGPALPGRPGEA